MPSGRKKRRAEKKKKQNDASSTNPSDEKLVTAVELPETVSIASGTNVCDVSTEAVLEIGSNQNNKEKESESADGVSAIGVIDMNVSGMCSEESKSEVSTLNNVQETEQLTEQEVQFLSKVLSEPFTKEECQLIDEVASAFLDDQIVPEELVNEPTLKEMQGNKPDVEAVDQLTEDLSAGLVISEEAQDSLKGSLESSFVEPQAIVDPVFDGNTAVINPSDVAGRLKEMLDELVHRSEKQLKDFKEMNVKISQLLDEIGSGKPN